MTSGSFIPLPLCPFAPRFFNGPVYTKPERLAVSVGMVGHPHSCQDQTMLTQWLFAAVKTTQCCLNTLCRIPFQELTMQIQQFQRSRQCQGLTVLQTDRHD